MGWFNTEGAFVATDDTRTTNFHQSGFRSKSIKINSTALLAVKITSLILARLPLNRLDGHGFEAFY
jgi:hypothetical protein